MVGYIVNVYAPALFRIRKSPNITNGSRHLFYMIQLGKDFLKNKAEYFEYQNTIENNIYNLTQEHVTLGLLSDDRKEKRKLGKDLIVKARIDKPKIKGIRFFTQQEFVNDVNFKAKDYSDFILFDRLEFLTEPPVTMNLTNQDLDDIVEGKSKLIELCGLQKVYCHTQVIIFLCHYLSTLFF